MVDALYMRSRRSRRSDLPFRRRVGSMFSHHSPYSGGQCTDRQRRQSLSATSLGGQVVRPSNAGRFRYCLAAESSIWRAANAANLPPIGIGGCLPDLTWLGRLLRSGHAVLAMGTAVAMAVVARARGTGSFGNPATLSPAKCWIRVFSGASPASSIGEGGRP
jgi:hypothetical protein